MPFRKLVGCLGGVYSAPVPHKVGVVYVTREVRNCPILAGMRMMVVEDSDAVTDRLNGTTHDRPNATERVRF